MQTNNPDQLTQLHNAFPCISMEALEELTRRRLLHIDGDDWRFGDGNNGATRKLSWPKFKHADNEGDEWHKLIGLEDVVRHDRRDVLIALEGSKDALAAAEIAHQFGVLAKTGVMCALGSGYRPIRREVEQLRGRWVGLIGDNDEPGIKAMQLVSGAMTDVGVDHGLWKWRLCKTNAKDVFGLLASMGGQKIPSLCVLSGTCFPPSPPSSRSGVHVFTCSCPETPQAHAGIGDDERLGIVAPYFVTKRATSNIMSFQLARKIKPMKLDMQDIDEIFKLWFAKSKPKLPRDADESEYLRRFYRQLKRVRFTECALKAACERARTATPPFIPARDGDVEVAKLAALCRELQRDARGRPFICPVGVVVDFIPVRWRSQAAWLIEVLEEEKVIECVDRGAPHKPGQKGKPSFWRYKLPLDQ